MAAERRADGRSATAVNRVAWLRCRTITSRCCSAGSCGSVTTSRGPMCEPSKRGTSRICWLARSRFTRGKRLKPCGRLYVRSNGRTMSFRSSRLSRGRCLRYPITCCCGISTKSGRLNPFGTKGAEPEFPPVREALDVLGALASRAQPAAHRRRRINKLLENTRAHAGFAFRPAGHQVLANVYRIVTMARNFELTGGISFRALVEELAEQAERPGEGEAAGAGRRRRGRADHDRA